MSPAAIKSDFINSMYSGIVSKGILNKSILPVFLAIVVLLFVVNYVGLYSMLNLISGGVFSSGYNYPSYAVPSALGLIAFEVFLFFYFLSLSLETKKRLDIKASTGTRDLLMISLSKYPKFFIASVFQVFVFMGGFVLLVVPGLYFGTKMLFFATVAHNNDLTISNSLRESTESIKGHFIKGLAVLVSYFVIFSVPTAITLASGIAPVWKILIVSILVSFVSISSLSSSDTLYHSVKSQALYRKPPMIKHVLGNPI